MFYKMMKRYIFIDDSGDPGVKMGASNNFVMSAVVFSAAKDVEKADSEISKFRGMLGWRSESEFKFRKTRKEIILELLKLSRDFNYEIYSIFTDKEMLKNCLSRVGSREVYNTAIAELLRMVPDADEVKVKIDGKTEKKYAKETRTYFRKIARAKKATVDYEDSRKNNLLQLADLVSGAVNRSLDRDKTDAGEYLAVIKKKITRLESGWTLRKRP